MALLPGGEPSRKEDIMTLIEMLWNWLTETQPGGGDIGPGIDPSG